MAYAFVPNLLSGSLSVINTDTNTVINTIDMSGYGTLDQIAITPNGYFAYIRTNLGIQVLSLATNTVIKTIPYSPTIEAPEPGGITVSPDGGHVYVATRSNFLPLTGTAIGCNTLTVIATSTNTVVADINAFPPSTQGGGTGALAITPDGLTVYMACEATTTVVAFDTATNTVKATISGIPTGGSKAQNIAITPDSSTVYVSRASSPPAIAVISTASNTITGTIALPGVASYCGALVVGADGLHLYASIIYNPGSSPGVNALVTISTSSNLVTFTNNAVTAGAIMGIKGNIVYVTDNNWVSGSPDSTVIAVNVSTNTVVATIGVGNDPRGIAITSFGGYAIVMNI